MRKIYILTAFLLASLTAVHAEKIDGRVDISNVKIEHIGDELYVKYTVTVPRGAVKRGYTLLFAPHIISNDGGQYGQSLSAVAVRGRGAKTSMERGSWVSGLTVEGEVTYLTNGRSTTIAATVPFQEWMYDSQLYFESVEGGCCSFRGLEDVLMDTGITKPEPEVSSEPMAWAPVTVADSLSTAFEFVLPESEYNEQEPFKIYDDERDNALVVYYHVGKYNLVPDYMNNAHTLSNLMNVIRMIMEASDSQVDRVVVAGFASPEGGFALNDRLAWDRAVTIKRYIMDRTGLADERIQLHNGSEDWRGLRAMVAKSDLPEKQQILDIIDNTPVWDARTQEERQNELMRLNGGVTYRRLLGEFFPYLRSGAFIRVYYDNN